MPNACSLASALLTGQATPNVRLGLIVGLRSVNFVLTAISTRRVCERSEIAVAVDM